jgi:hypothetical protein
MKKKMKKRNKKFLKNYNEVFIKGGKFNLGKFGLIYWNDKEIGSSAEIIKWLENLKEKLENYSTVKTATETLMMEKDLAKKRKK